MEKNKSDVEQDEPLHTVLEELQNKVDELNRLAERLPQWAERFDAIARELNSASNIKFERSPAAADVPVVFGLLSNVFVNRNGSLVKKS